MSEEIRQEAIAHMGLAKSSIDVAHVDINSLYEYWLRMAPAGRLPGRQHFDPMEIPHLLPNVWLIDVHRDPFRFWRRLVGTRIEEFAGRSLVNGWVADGVDERRQSSVHKILTDVVVTGQPSWRRGKSTIRHERGYSELERIYLPLASDGETVDMILAMTLFYKQPIPEPEQVDDHLFARAAPAHVYG